MRFVVEETALSDVCSRWYHKYCCVYAAQCCFNMVRGRRNNSGSPL